MWKITKINDCVQIEHNGAKRTYPIHGVDSFLLGFALDRQRKLEITTNQYNRLINEYNHLLHVAHSHNIVDLNDNYNKLNEKFKGEYKEDKQLVENLEL